MDNHRPESARAAGETLESRQGQQPTARADRVEISRDARRKLAELADKVRRESLHAQGASELELSRRDRPSDSLETESTEAGQDRKAKLEQVQDRMADGFYDRPATKNQIAEKLADEFIGSEED